tara:strand:+ start:1591 stop:2565 length:975 start_codon:yes stop_codon:yes gene_type:complete
MRKYNYKELKDLITTDYLTFNHIIESKHIFNQEFIKFRKFFKGLTKKITYVKDTEYNRELEKYVPIKRQVNPYFSSGTTEYYFTLTTENVVDLNIADIQKDFPNLKKDYDLLLSLKSNVRSGRRPKDLEKDYEAERLRKAQEEDKATCGICHQYWELVDMNGQKNIIADHGFTISKYGNGRNGVCFGARFHSWEKSPESKIQYVKRILKPTLEKVINDKPTIDTVNNLIAQVNVYRLEYDAYYKLSYEDRRKTEKPIAPEYILAGQQIGYSLTKIRNINLSLITEVWFEYKSRLIEEINIFETAIKNWTLQPTPREQLTKKKEI